MSTETPAPIVSDSLRRLFSVSVRRVAPQVRTDVDDTAARAAARDSWLASTRHYFVEACAHWRTHPEYALGRVRLVVEGFVHVVCVELVPKFNPHERRELRRLKLEDAIRAAKPYLPPDRLDLVNTLKNLGNIFHHNQGVVQTSSANIARAHLLQCAELLTWIDREVLRTPPPLDYVQALRELEGAAPVATPLPPLAGTAAGTPMPPAAVPSETKRIPRARWPLVAGVSVGAAAVLATAWFALASGGGAATVTSTSPEVEWIKRYRDAIATRDPDRIVAIHAIPSGRFFMTERQSAAQLRGKYEGWFRDEGKGRTVDFGACVLAGTGTDGSRAVRCDTHIDPPLDNGWSVIPTCLVFGPTGRLISRTESLRGPAPCPPPPLP
jgi:hypothetical protein